MQGKSNWAPVEPSQVQALIPLKEAVNVKQAPYGIKMKKSINKYSLHPKLFIPLSFQESPKIKSHFTAIIIKNLPFFL